MQGDSLDSLVRTLVDNYEKTDAETKRMVPLKRLYWPA
jgi:restriction system protein